MTRRRPLVAPFAALAIALLACGAAPAGAGAEAAEVADADRLAKALKLAQTVQPRELAVDQSLRTLDEQAVVGLVGDPDVKQMEAENPGIVAGMWKAARPFIAQSLAETLTDLWNAMAGVYVKHLTSAQLDESIRFFQSPTGRKFLVEMNRNVDLQPMIRDATRPGGGSIGEKSYLRTVAGAANATASAMSPAEVAELERFFRTPTAKALVGAGSDVTQVVLAWSNRDDPKTAGRVEAVMVKFVEEFFRSRP